MHISLPDGRSYPIHIGEGLIRKAGEYISSPRVIIVTDNNVEKHWLKPLLSSLSDKQVDHITLPAGEATKSFSQLEQLLDKLLSMKPDRKTTLIALGGGVIGDITGFAASTLLRGVPFIQIPTSLLAQVDSSVGGKTGINSKHGKNLIGSFYQPQAVIIDTETLSTLPDREMKSGFAEVIKSAIIADADFFSWLEDNHQAILNRDAGAVSHAINKSVEIKADIVMQDERESGVRALLNLGHTFGHALEVEYGYDGRLTHGEAVAVGIAMAFAYCAENNICPAEDASRCNALIEKSDLPVKLPEWPATETILGHMQADKKSENGKITLVLPHAIGDCFIEKDADDSMVVDFIDNYRQNWS